MFISRIDHLLTFHTKIWMKIVLKKLFLKKKKKKIYIFFSPPNYATQQKYLKIPLTWSPWTCKWFLIKCILMLSRLDRKMQFAKMEYTVSCLLKRKYNFFCAHTANAAWFFPAIIVVTNVTCTISFLITGSFLALASFVAHLFVDLRWQNIIIAFHSQIQSIQQQVQQTTS